MAIKPKYDFSGKTAEPSQKTEKQFTDREQYLDAFYGALSTKIKDEQKILVYYGVGGIGKSSLRKELGKRLDAEKSDTIWTAIDFDNPSDREEESALFLLRNNLNKKYNINFPLFDIAYTVYWQKTHPQVPLTVDNFPLLEGVNIITEILHLLGEMPQIGFVPKLTKAFIANENIYRKWWEKRGKKELMNLPSMEPKDISARLPMYFATDLKDYIKENKKDAVLFLDTYEALWETIKTDIGFFERDEWLRELVSQLPEVIWIICGREKLRWGELDEEWNKYTEQHLLGSLSEEDSRYFLRTCGIENTEVQNVIITASKGVPYFLDLAVDTYYEIKTRHKREPATEDFAKTQNDVLERFLKYLDYAEIETLKTLSVARVWSGDIFRLLVKKFRTGYAITKMNNLFRFSFINEVGKTGIYTMHDLMSESLQKKLDADKSKMLHKTLFDYYDEKLKNIEVKNIDETAKQNLIEASYHGKAGLNPGEYFDWFNNRGKTFFQAAQYTLLLPISQDLINMMEVFKGKESIEYAKALHELAKIYHQLGKYNESELIFQQALEKKEKLLGFEHLEVGRALDGLARSLYFQGKFFEAEPMIKRSIDIIEKNLGRDCKEVYASLNDLAILYAQQGKYDIAELLFKRILNFVEKHSGSNHPDIAAILSSLANIYLDLSKFDEAKDLYLRALSIKISVFGEFHPSVGRSNIDLGNIYLEQERYDEAESYYKKANEIFKSTFGDEHPETAIVINNIAYLNFKIGNYNESFSLYKKALKIFKKTLENNHPNTATTINSMGLLFLKQKKFREAEILFKRSLKIRTEVLGDEHIDVADSYKYLGELYVEQSRVSGAAEYIEKAKNILEKILGKENSDVINLSEKINKLKNKNIS